MRHDGDRLRRAGADLHQQPLGGLRHHDHAFGLVTESRQNLELMLRRLRQHRVQRHDERLRKLAHEREHVVAVPAAEDAVLVLEQNDVDVGPAERASRANVVAACVLGDGAQSLGPLRARWLVHDDDLADVVHVADVEQRSPNVEGEGADPAGARWKRRKDRGTHGWCVPFRQMSEAHVSTAGSIGWLPA